MRRTCLLSGRNWTGEGKIDPEKERKYRSLLTDQLDTVMANASQAEVDAWRLAVGSAVDGLSGRK